jgi:hypothetical protein
MEEKMTQRSGGMEGRDSNKREFSNGKSGDGRRGFDIRADGLLVKWGEEYIQSIRIRMNEGGYIAN